MPTKKNGTGRLPPRSWTASAGWGTVLIAAYVVVALAPFALVLILNGGFRDNILVELGRGAALVGFVLLVLQVVLAGRFKRLDAPFGLDVVMRFHKRMAIVAVVLLLAHPLLFVIGRGSLALLSTDMPWPIDLGKAALAWAFLIVIFAMLFEQFGVDYNVWRFTHKAAVLILVLGFIHATQVGTDLQTKTSVLVLSWVLFLVAAGIFIYRNLYVPVWGRRPFEVSEVRQETHDTYSVRLEPRDGKPLTRAPGQFMFLRLIRPGRKSEMHPFTIAASPLEPDIVEATIKQSGNFTNTIDQTRPGDTGRIEGPFGRFSLVHHDIRRFTLIAGGVGITPIMSMLRFLRDTDDQRPVTLIYGNKTAADIIFDAELKELPEHMAVIHVLSHADSDWRGPTGYITRTVIEDAVGQRIKDSHVFVCGPPPMMDAVIRVLDDIGVGRDRVHHERFTI